MTSTPLAGLRVVEISAFVAAPLAGMTLAQLGADVIRIDPLGGNIDIHRMPHAPGGDSIYWASLNKGKRSITLALETAEGQEMARRIICAPGKNAGIVVTNLQPRPWMTYESLSTRRPDIIMMRLTGNRDGSTAVDYTVNCASGFPIATGATRDPINHVLPAWDITAGLYIATGLLAAERSRRETGLGQELSLALSDVMLATVANLGYVADVQINESNREPIGNDLYGAFGRNFVTADDRQVMIAAISDKQWRAIGKATGLSEQLAMIGPILSVDLSCEEGRFEARAAIAAVLQPWFKNKTLAEVALRLNQAGVLWGPYQDFQQLVKNDARCSIANPLFEQLDQPGLGPVLLPRSPIEFSKTRTPSSLPAPVLGADTVEVLQELAGLTLIEAQQLMQRGFAGEPTN